MKMIIKINPKNLFRSKKTPSVSKSNPASFSSGKSSSSSSSSSSSTNHKGGGDSGGPVTPTSVLPSQSNDHEISSSSDWSDSSADVNLELVQAFKLIDKDGDGKITRFELQTFLSRIGASEEELLMMLTEVDPAGRGCISLEEFGAIGSAFGPACGSELCEVFSFFDADGDGKISADELLGVFGVIGDDGCTLEDCRRMIGDIDTDGDGFVCFEDFSRESELPELPTSIDSTEMDDSTATSTTSIDEADTELQSRTLKGRRRPDIAHLSMFIRASKPDLSTPRKRMN
ncbi:hypothetical protein HHK36_017220 [Tetracentron sinense]|uniref:EF-hand domain-containing protein n=1 Tax=Tetracentron sinense TaxID=13715 RepID=A0A835DCD6_TETSI|nr:hypothetical protein HHK36_017220 [Tetracentron sinense]